MVFRILPDVQEKYNIRNFSSKIWHENGILVKEESDWPHEVPIHFGKRTDAPDFVIRLKDKYSRYLPDRI